MTHEHHDVVVEKDSSGLGALALVLGVVILLVVLWLAFGGSGDTTSEGGGGDVVPTTLAPEPAG